MNVVVGSLDVVKTADPTLAGPGDTVVGTRSIVTLSSADVTNTGNIAVTPAVSDPGCPPLEQTALQNDIDPCDVPVRRRQPGQRPVGLDHGRRRPVHPAYDSGDTNANSLLDPGETWIFLCTTNPTDDVVNHASVEGTDSLGISWSDDDSETLNVVTPSITVGKVAGATVIYAADVAVYCYQVFNDGDPPRLAALLLFAGVAALAATKRGRVTD